FVSGFWAGGAVYQFNKIADVSQPVWGSTTVTAMRESREKTGTSYHVKVAPWSASPHETVELTVSRETYEMLRPGAAVDIGVRRGALQNPRGDEASPGKEARVRDWAPLGGGLCTASTPSPRLRRGSQSRGAPP